MNFPEWIPIPEPETAIPEFDPPIAYVAIFDMTIRADAAIYARTVGGVKANRKVACTDETRKQGGYTWRRVVGYQADEKLKGDYIYRDLSGWIAESQGRKMFIKLVEKELT